MFAENTTGAHFCLSLEPRRRLTVANPCADKVIIISSFTSALDLMNEFLLRKGVKSCRYQGDMNISEREEAIRRLKKSNKCKVMLRTFLCARFGLPCSH